MSNYNSETSIHSRWSVIIPNIKVVDALDLEKTCKIILSSLNPDNETILINHVMKIYNNYEQHR